MTFFLIVNSTATAGPQLAFRPCLHSTTTRIQRNRKQTPEYVVQQKPKELTTLGREQPSTTSFGTPETLPRFSLPFPQLHLHHRSPLHRTFKTKIPTHVVGAEGGPPLLSLESSVSRSQKKHHIYHGSRRLPCSPSPQTYGFPILHLLFYIPHRASADIGSTHIFSHLRFLFLLSPEAFPFLTSHITILLFLHLLPLISLPLQRRHLLSTSPVLLVLHARRPATPILSRFHANQEQLVFPETTKQITISRRTSRIEHCTTPTSDATQFYLVKPTNASPLGFYILLPPAFTFSVANPILAV